jgi:hypothetical protein
MRELNLAPKINPSEPEKIMVANVIRLTTQSGHAVRFIESASNDDWSLKEIFGAMKNPLNIPVCTKYLGSRAAKGFMDFITPGSLNEY